MLSKAPRATPRFCLKLFTSGEGNPIDLHSAAVYSYKAQRLRASPVARIPHCFTGDDSQTQGASVQDNLDDLIRRVARGRGVLFP